MMHSFIFCDSLHSQASVLEHCTSSQDSGPDSPFSSWPNLIFNAEYCLWDLLSQSKSMFWCKLNLIVVKVAVLWGTRSWWGGRELRRAYGGMICYESLIFCVHVWFSVVLWEAERSLLRIMHVIEHYVVYLLLSLNELLNSFHQTDLIFQ